MTGLKYRPVDTGTTVINLRAPDYNKNLWSQTCTTLFPSPNLKPLYFQGFCPQKCAVVAVLKGLMGTLFRFALAHRPSEASTSR